MHALLDLCKHMCDRSHMRLRKRVWEPDYERGRANVITMTKLVYTLIAGG